MVSSQNSKSEYVEPGFLHRLLFTWLLGILKLGGKRPITQDDMYPLSDEYKAENMVQRLEETWAQELNNSRTKRRQPKLWKAIFRVLPLKNLLMTTILKLTAMFMQNILIVLLWLLFNYLQGESLLNKWHLILIVLAVGVCNYIRVFSYHHCDYIALSMGIQLKVAVMGLIYKKILLMTGNDIRKATSGAIMNLLSNDTQWMEELLRNVFFAVVGLLVIPIGILLLWALVGWQALSGVLILCLFAICQSLLLRVYGRIRYKQKRATDRRLAAVKDIVSGMRAVKMYAMEEKFSDRIGVLRRKEIKLLHVVGGFTTVPGSQIFTLPMVATLVSTATILYSDVPANLVNIFTVVLLYNSLGIDVALCCNYDFIQLVNNLTSIRRIQEFLMISRDLWNYHKPIEDQEKISLKSVMKCLSNVFSEKKVQKESSKYARAQYSLIANDDSHTNSKTEPIDATIAPNVTVNKMAAGWFEDDELCILHDISFTTEPNQLLMVTGPVGSGKSTLLMAILREIPVKSGRVSTHGKVAYVGQHPWIYTGTIRENILFGRKFDQKRYQKALDVCDLNEDIGRFPKGDMSVTGQRGITLSGGQRVRVSLARAVYSNADIYLLDDPLSALDVKVGQYVMDECICNELSSRIRILVTHQHQHLHRADNILLIQEGRLLAQGSHEQLIGEGWIGHDLQPDSKPYNLKKDQEGEAKIKHKSLMTEDPLRDMEEEEEDREIGKVTWQVYWNYLRAGLHPVLIGCFFLFYLTVQGSLLAPQLWLSQMAELSKPQQKSSKWLGMLATLVFAAFVLCCVKDWLFYSIFINASKNLHHKMTQAVLKSPVLFFDTNPLGRIMNRFSKDIGCMDNLLPLNILIATGLSTNAACVVLLSFFTNIWLIPIAIPLGVLLVFIFYYYINVVRDLKRIEAIQCSPIYAHAMETITGLEVIRTLHMQDNFLKKMFSFVDEYSKVLHVSIATGRWFNINNELLFATLMTAMTGISLAASVDKALAAMLLSVTIGLLSTIEYALTELPEIEREMTSVERVLTFTNLAPEPGYNRNTQPPDDWPTNGALSLRNVSLVYFEGGPRVLKDISLDVKPCETLGIAGRTGAGKSSLVASLLRMPDPEGSVFVDGVDLGTIHLQAARRSMAVITQDPVVFIGSLRRNLDPFDNLTDLQLWSALEEVQLKEKVLSLDGQLQYLIGEEGSGLSAGERQLMCLARALLQRCKILVLDEATANIDYQTDQLIQQTIRNKFANCTVLTIAHRLNTIADYDKVVVLEDGQVIEHASPGELAKNENSIFTKLVSKSLTNGV